MTAPYLLSGSFAYDTILLHQGEFHARLLPEALTRLNVAFGVDGVHHEFGGTGGNIAYNAARLGQRPLLVGSLGHDGDRYLSRLSQLGLAVGTLTLHADAPTAHAWILTDTVNNQITGFHAGAMAKPPYLPEVTPNLWHLAPDRPTTTAALVLKAIEQGKCYIFDPGQALPAFLEGKADALCPLSTILQNATGIFVNEYEAELLENHLGHPLSSLLARPEQFIVRTLGGQGAELVQMQGVHFVPAYPVETVVDPTGCGDALRAGFLFGYTQGWALERCLRHGAVIASFAVECSGGQSHHPTTEDIQARLAQRP